MGQSDLGRVSHPVVPPTGAGRVASEAEARALAHRLLTPGRRWPVVVLTIPAGHDEPFGDPAEIKQEVGDLAEVVVMPTGGVSWAFSHEMPPTTQVYGGAGRVYPVDHDWVHAPERLRLRFAYSVQDRRRITDQLISDALAAALSAGLLEPQTSSGLRHRSGTVQGVIGSRALIALDDTTVATVWEELTVPGVPLDRVLARGQPVRGIYDPTSRLLDLRGALRYVTAANAEAAVAAYQIGDVVLADVLAVTDDTVTLRLLPGLAVQVDREAVTTNPNDKLVDLFTVGEVVTCRITAAEPVRLRMDDVDDDEAPKPAPSLLPDGPPWLRPPDLPPAATTVAHPSVLTPDPPVVPAPPQMPDPAPARPTPLDVIPWQATRGTLADELQHLRARAADLESALTEATQKVEKLQTSYRKAENARQQAVKQLKAAQSRVEHLVSGDGPGFLDPEEQFRHEIYCEWVRRVPAAEKAAKPLADYTLGADFLDSLERIEGISRSKVVAVVVEVLTGQGHHLPGRDQHQLRAGAAGSLYASRADGATCWRVALQRETAAARRLHYWRTRDGYELSRVVLHDDYRP